MDRTNIHQPRTFPRMRASHSPVGASVARFAHSRILSAFLAAALFLLIAPAVGYATNISVCASGCNQTDIGTAVQAANPGDTVVIGAGTFPANVVIAKNLTLQGAGAGQTILDGGLMLSGALAATYTITGFVNGDTAAVVAGGVVSNLLPGTYDFIGTYPIYISPNGLYSPNYVFTTFVPGTLTVLP